MKTFKTIPVAATTRRVLDFTTCDLCHATTRSEWRDGSFDAIETEVMMKTGDNWPEGGSGETTTFDICPTCFVARLMPWLKSQGAEPEVKEWEW